MISNHIPTQTNLQDLSKDEQNNLIRAMKKPQFMGLMNDYMMEISDPKNKDEYDQYLEQLANDGELPKGLKLVRPDPEFCLKTAMTAEKDKGQDQKLFINVCSSEIVGRPTFEVKTHEGRSGQQWSLPYSAGKIRYDQTSKEEVCNTIDVAFHPYAFDIASKNPRFQELVCSTSVDACIKQMGERTETISRDYKVLKNTKCKGGTPALLTVRVHGKPGDNMPPSHISEMEKRQGGEGQAPKLYNDLMKQKEEYQDQKQSQEDKKKKELETKDDEEVEPTETFEFNEQGERIVKVPTHKIVYTYPVDYSEFLDNTKKQRQIPIEIGLNVHLLGIESVKEVDLDIDTDKVVLNVQGKYFLEKTLPYPILKDQGSAKFDSKKKLLRIRLKIDKSNIELPDTVHDKQITRKFHEAVDEKEADEDDKYDTKIIKDSEQNPEDKGADKQQQEGEVLEFDDQKQNMIHFVKEEESQAFLTENIEGKEDLQKKKEGGDSDDENEEDKLDLLKVEKPNIEEIEQKPEQEQEKKEQEITPIKKTYNHLTFLTQEDSSKFFFIINIPSYQKSQVTSVILEKQVLVLFENEKRVDYLRLQIDNDIIEEKSNISYVTDYVVVNLVKLKEETYWDKKGFEQKKDDFEDFKQCLQELQEAQKILDDQKKEQEEQNKLKKIENKQNTDLNELSDDEEEAEDNVEQKKQIEQDKEQEIQAEKKTEEQLKQEEEEEQRQKLMEKLKTRIENQKNIVQFIDYSESCGFAYEID